MRIPLGLVQLRANNVARIFFWRPLIHTYVAGVRGHLLRSDTKSFIHEQGNGTHSFQVLVGHLHVLQWVGTQEVASTDLLGMPPYLLFQVC